MLCNGITLHALTGGVIAELNGEKFGHGFISAGFTKGIGTPILSATSANMVVGTVASMVIGGTASELSGGKFANGAMTAAFQTLYNHYRVTRRNDQVIDSFGSDSKNREEALVELANYLKLNYDFSIDEFGGEIFVDLESGYWHFNIRKGVGGSLQYVPEMQEGTAQFGTWHTHPNSQTSHWFSPDNLYNYNEVRRQDGYLIHNGNHNTKGVSQILQYDIVTKSSYVIAESNSKGFRLLSSRRFIQVHEEYRK